MEAKPIPGIFCTGKLSGSRPGDWCTQAQHGLTLPNYGQQVLRGGQGQSDGTFALIIPNGMAALGLDTRTTQHPATREAECRREAVKAIGRGHENGLLTGLLP